MEIYWSGRGQLSFRVHLKPNQQLLYLNRGSSHTSSCYRTIESVVLGRLAKLTSATAANLGHPIHQLYPEHAKALQRAGLSSSRLPTLKQVLDCRSGSQGCSRSRSATKSRAVFLLFWFLQILEDANSCVIVAPPYQTQPTLASSFDVLPPFQQSSRVISGAPE
jgi:hypothetical protein